MSTTVKYANLLAFISAVNAAEMQAVPPLAALHFTRIMRSMEEHLVPYNQTVERLVAAANERITEIRTGLENGEYDEAESERRMKAITSKLDVDLQELRDATVEVGAQIPASLFVSVGIPLNLGDVYRMGDLLSDTAD